MKNSYIAIVCFPLLFTTSFAKADLTSDTWSPASFYTFLMTDVTGGKINLNDKEIETLQNAFSIVLTPNSSAGSYGGVDFTLNVLDPAIFNKGLAKFTPTGSIGSYVDPNYFFKAGSQLNFGDGATANASVTSTLLFSSSEYTWESFASYLENEAFIIVGHLQSLNQPSIQGATLIWEGKIERNNETPPATPEPASVLIFGTGLLGLGLACRRKRRSSIDG